MKGVQPPLPGLDERMQRIARRARVIVEVVGDAIRRRGDTWDGAAALLDAAFGPDGRPVASSVLSAAFAGRERNYARLEWLALVLDDPEVQAALTPPPALTPEQELAAMREHFARRAPGELEAFDRKVRRG